MIYSHPDKLLIDHLNNVYRLGREIFTRKKLNFANLAEIEKALAIILLSHDFGKATSYFQRKLEKASKIDDRSNEQLEFDQELSKHSHISALLAYQFADQILEDKILVWLVFINVYRHHSNFKDLDNMLEFDDSDWPKLRKQFEALDFDELDTITAEISNFDFKPSSINFDNLKKNFTNWRFRKKLRDFKNNSDKDFKYYLISNLLFSILIFADKAEAIFHSKGYSFEDLEKVALNRSCLKDNIVDNYRELKGWNQADNKINEKRNEIYNEVVNQIGNINMGKERILSINVPTGSGKTLSVFSAALKLRNKISQYFRIIYALPFTSIIDQNYDVFLDVLNNSDLKVDSTAIIKHHYLNAKRYYFNEEDKKNQKLDYDIARHLIESWQSEIVVTTFVQLLHSIFSNRNRSLIKFNNISNSIIILDEVQNIPHKYWKLIKKFLSDMAEKLNCYFIFLTATMPLIYDEQKQEIKELAVRKKEHFDFFDRINLDTSLFDQPMTISQFEDFIEEELKNFNNQSFLIIINTIKSSIEIFNYIEELINEKVIEGELIYLSANIIPKERQKRINEIGKKKRQIIISTQMVEAGVDIDLDRVYRDFAPLDSINQSCGRCNRNFDPEKKGTVKLFKLINENHNDKEYASYVYDNFLLKITADIINELPEKVGENSFFEINQKYFDKINELKSNDKSEALINKIKNLKYEKSFFKDDKNEIFKLIDDDFNTINLFMAVDEDAEELWRNYKEINVLESNNIEDYMLKKSKFEDIKKEFLSYVITIPKFSAQKHLGDEQLKNNFNYISPFQIEDVYNLNTGFKRGKIERESFF